MECNGIEKSILWQWTSESHTGWKFSKSKEFVEVMKHVVARFQNHVQQKCPTPRGGWLGDYEHAIEALRSHLND
jgi:hypothetical protein